MQRSGFHDQGRISRRVGVLETKKLQKLSSEYKCRIANHTASESDYRALVVCQRELSRRLSAA